MSALSSEYAPLPPNATASAAATFVAGSSQPPPAVKKPLLIMHRSDRDEHHDDDQHGPERPAEAERGEQPARRLAEARHQREETPRTKADAFEEAAGAGDAAAAEPPEELLSPVGGDSEAEDQPDD